MRKALSLDSTSAARLKNIAAKSPNYLNNERRAASLHIYSRKSKVGKSKVQSRKVESPKTKVQCAVGSLQFAVANGQSPVASSQKLEIIDGYKITDLGTHQECLTADLI